MGNDRNERVGRALQPGSAEDFALLYESTYPRLVSDLTRGFGNQATAEECVQQAFEKAWKAWPNWKPISDPEAWIARIALRTALNRRTYDLLRTVPELLRRFGKPASGSDPADVAFDSELVQALKTLPMRDRLIIIWYYDHGLTIRQIAERVGKSPRTVDYRLSAARAALRSQLESMSPERGALRGSLRSAVGK
jgi:RNA polymerase sigma-70 factor (ECF subfamily)